MLIKNGLLHWKRPKIGALVLESKRLKNRQRSVLPMLYLGLFRSKNTRNLPWDTASKGMQERIGFARHHDNEIDDWPDLSEEWLQDNLDEWLMPYMAGKNSLADFAKLEIGRNFILPTELGTTKTAKRICASAVFSAPRALLSELIILIRKVLFLLCDYKKCLGKQMWPQWRTGRFLFPFIY